MGKITTVVNHEHVAYVLAERRRRGMDKGFTIGRNPWRTPTLTRLIAGSAERPGEDTDPACQ